MKRTKKKATLKKVVHHPLTDAELASVQGGRKATKKKAAKRKTKKSTVYAPSSLSS